MRATQVADGCWVFGHDVACRCDKCLIESQRSRPGEEETARALEVELGEWWAWADRLLRQRGLSYSSEAAMRQEVERLIKRLEEQAVALEQLQRCIAAVFGEADG